MAIKGNDKYKRRSGSSESVPTASLADIAFLLLIFFMVTTVFREEQDRDVERPDAEATEEIDRRRDDIVNIWIEPDGDIWINDELVPMEDVSDVVQPLWVESNRELVVNIRADSHVAYHYVDAVQEQLRQAGAIYVSFWTSLAEQMQRERR